MVKLGSNLQFSDRDQADVIVSICSLGLMLCMVVVVLGIKFRWFKQRLTFEQLPTDPSGSADNGQVTLKRSSRSSQEQIRNPVMAQGIFRKKLDEDVMIERPKTLPPIRIRKSSKGAPTFGPPKRLATTSSVVEQPVVAPPPPPPLPSVSSLSLSSLGKIPSAKTPPAEEKKVYFNSTVPVIANGEANQTYDELKTEEDQSKRQYTERRATGYIRPSSEIAQVLQEQQNGKPQAQPRTATAERPKTSFKKNVIRTHTESLVVDVEEDQGEHSKMGQRRLTGFFGPSEEDLKALGDNDDDDDDSESDDLNSDEKHRPKVKFDLEVESEDDDDDDDEDVPPPLPPTSPPPLLFSSQVSNEDNRSSTDSWSAIQRHRNLAQEISEQHEAMQNRRRENAEAANPVSVPIPVPEFRNPLAAQQLQQPKPRTMRDMKRNNAKNDLLLDGERDDTEA